MIKEPQVLLFDLIICLSNIMDLITPAIVDHQKRVSYIAYNLAKEIGLESKNAERLIFAGLLHDCGALSLKERINLLNYNVENPFDHSEMGYRLINKYNPLADCAKIIKFHHVKWKDGKGAEVNGEKVSLESHIIHLADRIDVLISANKSGSILGETSEIVRIIEDSSGDLFVPDLVCAFKSLSKKEAFWFDCISNSLTDMLKKHVKFQTVELNSDGLSELADLFRQIIDFRSRFTATHSSGVASSAQELSKIVGFSEQEAKMMKIAGYFHDLGKLAVPSEILEKEAELNRDEFNIIRSHTFYTYRSLEAIDTLETINKWGAFHHERLDGNGYPFHIKGGDLSLGSRIMAIADVFTALTENRPYRKGTGIEGTMKIIEKMSLKGALDPNLVSITKQNFNKINIARENAQIKAGMEFEKFDQDLI